MRKRFGYSEQEKVELVIRRIRLGASTIKDLIRETGFNQQDVYRITKDLEARRVISVQAIRMADGAGRPLVLMFLNDDADEFGESNSNGKPKNTR